MKRTTIKCEICNGFYSKSNIKKHKARCKGYITNEKRDILQECDYCKKSFLGLTLSEKANHTRWCCKNPKHTYYLEKQRSVVINNRNNHKLNYKSIGDKIKEHHKKDVYDKAKERQRQNPNFLGKKHLDKSKELIRQKALNSKHRRLVKSTRLYEKLDGTKILLDSSWEELLARRLDKLKIKWIRPEPLPWVDSSGKTHNYFPDFYLPNYDLYLDPKNPHAFSVQIDKITILKQKYKNILFLKSVEDIKNYKPC